MRTYSFFSAREISDADQPPTRKTDQHIQLPSLHHAYNHADALSRIWNLPVLVADEDAQKLVAVIRHKHLKT